MKKMLFVVLLFILISCSKKQDWYCECGPPGTSTVTYTTTISNATKGNASDLCNKAAGANLAYGTYACNVSAQ